jgi:hypothetical protein
MSSSESSDDDAPAPQPPLTTTTTDGGIDDAAAFVGGGGGGGGGGGVDTSNLSPLSSMSPTLSTSMSSSSMASSTTSVHELARAARHSERAARRERRRRMITLRAAARKQYDMSWQKKFDKQAEFVTKMRQVGDWVVHRCDRNGTSLFVVLKHTPSYLGSILQRSFRIDRYAPYWSIGMQAQRCRYCKAFA